MAIKIGTGIGKGGTPFQAGETAARQAIDQIGAEQCDLVLVFSAAKFDLVELIKGIRTITGEAKLVGGTTYGEIFNGGQETGTVIVMCMKTVPNSGAFPNSGVAAKIVTAFCKGLKTDSRRVGVQLAEQLIQGISIPVKGTMIILSDGSGGNVSALIRGIYDTVGAGVQILGGSFANDINIEVTYQFFNEEIFTDGVCGVYLPPEIQIGVGIKHGWFPLGDLMLVTKARENILYELDNRPAAEVYTEKFNIVESDVTQEVPVDPDNLDYPLGIFEFGGGYSIRQLYSNTPERGIICYGEIPQNAMVSLMWQTKKTLIDAVEEAALKTISMMAGKKIKAVLVFDCVSRFLLLEKDSVREIEALRKVFGEEIPIFGFYTFGEIGVLEGGPPRFHNKTVVVCAIGE
ncbi:MAG TPA: FIST N-terminal domain-containing protein [Bacillota bacterium]|nr:FIST N-terminal domain-containing protein [Bacillota bacterium]